VQTLFKRRSKGSGSANTLQEKINRITQCKHSSREDSKAQAVQTLFKRRSKGSGSANTLQEKINRITQDA